MENKGSKTMMFVIRLVVALALFFLALLYLPSITSVVLVISGIFLLPIKPLDEFLEKYNVTAGTRVVLLIFIFVIYWGCTSKSGSSEGGYSGNVSSGNGSEVSQSSSVDITGTWKYVEEQAIDCDYKFNSDGTFRYNSEGGAWDEGTYVVEDGVIKTTGQFYNEEFKIIDKKTIENAYGDKLKRK